MLLADLSEDRIRDYIRARLREGASRRTINMELGELSRAIGHKWSSLWPRIRKLEERKDIGRALSIEEQARILDASGSLRSPVIGTLVPLLLLTGMRPGEALSLTWRQIELFDKTITVGRAKTSNGTARTMPIVDDLAHVLAAHRDWFASSFRDVKPEHYVFPFGSPQPVSPDKPVTDIVYAQRLPYALSSD